MTKYFNEDGATEAFTALIDKFGELTDTITMAMAAHEEDDPTFKTHRVEPLIALTETFIENASSVLKHAVL